MGIIIKVIKKVKFLKELRFSMLSAKIKAPK